MQRTMRVLRGVLFFVVLQTTNGFSQDDPIEKMLEPIREKLRATRIESGVLVASMTKGGAADEAGLLEGDLILKINDEPVSSTTQFVSIRDRLRGSLVKFTFWREGKYITSSEIVMPPAVGITGEEWSYSMSQILLRIEAGDMDTAGTLAQQAEAAHLLTQRNSLIAKLLLLPNDVPVPGSEQDKLTRELVETISTTVELSATAFRLQHYGRPWPAIPVRRKLVAMAPNDVNHRLNLAQLLARQKLSDEAEQNIRYRVEHRLPLNNHGFSVEEDCLSTIAANREQWREAYEHHVQAIEYQLKSAEGYGTGAYARDSALRHVALAAHLRDIDVFQEALRLAQGFGGPMFQSLPPYLDAFRAFVLVSTNHKDEATSLVMKWKGKPDWQSVYDYLAVTYPDCAKNWKTLADR